MTSHPPLVIDASFAVIGSEEDTQEVVTWLCEYCSLPQVIAHSTSRAGLIKKNGMISASLAEKCWKLFQVGGPKVLDATEKLSMSVSSAIMETSSHTSSSSKASAAISMGESIIAKLSKTLEDEEISSGCSTWGPIVGEKDCAFIVHIRTIPLHVLSVGLSPS